MTREWDVERLYEDIGALREGLRRLTERVYTLEQAAGGPREAPTARAVEPATARMPADPAPVIRVAEPAPSAIEYKPTRMPDPQREWEEVLGGNWLNKVGVLVLVIGLGLFLWYSFGRMGPAGRVTVALAVSAAMLAGGVVLERREKYKVAARGLIGGGWAALYSTVYAAHAVQAARVINSPTAATLLLACVAVGMILHSLRYRSQAVTGLAYFAAFATLAISPLAYFALIALAPLAISLVYLAQRFRWTAMALLGMPATYGIYMLHAARSSGGSLAVGQSVLFVYWLVFESFDVLYASRMQTEGARPCPAFPFNAAAFLLVSAMQWHASSAANLYLLFVLSAAVYLGSAAVRAVLLPREMFPEGTAFLDRIRGGSHEGAITIAAALTAVALALKLSGLSLSVAFVVEAELLFLAGVYGGQAYLRHLGTALLLISTARMAAVDLPNPTRISIGSTSWHAWTPVALLQAGAFYLNQLCSRRDVLQSFAGAALLLLVLGFEAPSAAVLIAWALLSLVLLLLGSRLNNEFLMIQGSFVAVLALIRAMAVNLVRDDSYAGFPVRIASCAVVIAAFYLVEFLQNVRDHPLAGPVYSSVASALLALLLAAEVSGGLLTVAWGSQGALLLFAGFPLRQRRLRVTGLALLLVCVGKLFIYDLSSLDMPFRVMSFLVLGAILIGVSLIYSRFRERISRYL